MSDKFGWIKASRRDAARRGAAQDGWSQRTKKKRLGRKRYEPKAGTPTATAPCCGGAIKYTLQQFKDGTEHVRIECAKCKQFLGYGHKSLRARVELGG